MKETTDFGMNRTGIGMSPIDSKELIEGSEKSTPSSAGSAHAIAEVRIEEAREQGIIGTLPPPTSVKGAVTTIVGSIGKNPSVFLDKLGERLAFERTGARLYEGLLAKFEALGSYKGGPTRELLEEFHAEELQHFHLLRNAMEKMGADPTAVTPSADIAGVEATGILQVIADPRTTLAQSLHAMLVAELADNEGWDMLVELATNMGNEDIFAEFNNALQEEEKHLAYLRQWVTEHTTTDAEGDIEKAAA